MKLNDATLKELPKAVLRPNYDRARLTPGIVHIGVGNFHRAHQAWYLHRLMQQGEALDWAIIGAGVRTYDAAMRDKLLAQDCLTTLIELDPSSSTAEVVGSMIDYLPIEENNTALIEQMARPDIRIVAMTVTEGGYFIDPATKEFDAAHPDIVHDSRNPKTPRTAFGAIVAALRLRRDTGIGPFTCLCCDNLLGNGDVLRKTLVSLARLSNSELADWIDATCTFPNSMVDSIVPATGPDELALAHQLGIDDQVPVTHESFRQWVIEDDFCAGRPDWDKVGATFTDDVHGYEALKIRILNGGHQVVSVPGEVLSIKTIADCMKHDLIGPLFTKVAQEEIAPLVKPVLGMTSKDYVALIHKRLSNPKIIDTTRRVAFDGSSRHPGFIIPSIREGLAKGTPIDGLVLVEAAWARMCEGTREDGSKIDPNDPFWEDLTATARQARENPTAWLEMRQIYGDLADEPGFADRFAKWLGVIWDEGLEAAIATYLKP
ncbi:mannitol dehydrogenase family protein [Aliiroseovarius subalbicans]|uniref:mannitol dehydrogenase family protein n=1 Tax=Aliiroseovarius subalbicans TaxID=2925840 RepID=UPI001F599A4B|nr:mannitol dehydrogenase family protein [Aliiroseovarius subalbicans]MCI2400320.1 mannitol dehydrogenase family protein [Aliiroseovarius subalbicans]